MEKDRRTVRIGDICRIRSRGWLKLMKSKCFVYGVIVLMIIGVTLISGCVRGERVPIIDLDSIQQYVDRNVTVEGCLEFACPTIVGANYPEDCLATICDENHNCINNLEFDNSTKHLRNTLDHYYPEVFSSCVKIEVKGTVVELSCPGSDPACVTTYKIKVIDLLVLP